MLVVPMYVHQGLLKMVLCVTDRQEIPKPARLVASLVLPGPVVQDIIGLVLRVLVPVVQILKVALRRVRVVDYRTGTTCSGILPTDSQSCASCGFGGSNYNCGAGKYRSGPLCTGTTGDTQRCSGSVLSFP